MSGFDEIARRIVELRGYEDAPIVTYPVPVEEIEAAERDIGKPFPEPLKEVWRSIGGGFFHAPLEGGERLDAVNCLMGPLDVADVMKNRGWTGEKATAFPFFNEDDEDFLLLVATQEGLSVEHENARGAALAEDPKDLVIKLAANPAYWIDLLPAP